MATARVLIFTGETAVRSHFTFHLARLGQLSVAAEEFAKAIQIVREQDISMVLMSADVLQSSGITFLDAVKMYDKVSGRRRTPVILLTESVSQQRMYSGFAVHDHLPRNAAVGEVQRLLSKWLVTRQQSVSVSA